MSISKIKAIDITILEKNTKSKEICDSIKRKYEQVVRLKRSVLQAWRKEFKTLEMKLGENVSDYFPRVMGVANKIRIQVGKIRKM
jgi:stress response protein YsnF